MLSMVRSIATQAASLALAIPACAQLQVERAPQWDELFHRQSGWTGADGIFSISLDGVDARGGAGQRDTLFLFSDTFIGDVAADGSRVPGSTLVNNTLALLHRTTQPSERRTQFYWATTLAGEPQAVFVPSTQNTQPGEWYWLLDGVVLDHTLYIFAMRMKRTDDGGAFAFAVVGGARLRIDLEQSGSRLRRMRALAEQVETPLFVPANETRGDLIFGSAILVNTAASGAVNPDGYVYVYGTQNDAFNKKLVAARVLPADFEDFAAWRYWNGSTWVASIAQAAPVAGAERISSEHSVTPLSDGAYVSVSQQDTLGPYVQLHFGPSPIGPFGAPVLIWRCPEVDEDPDIFCYNAKAHPHLSAQGELLISYNVNSFDFADHFADAGLYRPRFIRVQLGR